MKRNLPAIPPEPLFITTDFWKDVMKFQMIYNQSMMNLQADIIKVGAGGRSITWKGFRRVGELKFYGPDGEVK